jgi:hypothetical protein
MTDDRWDLQGMLTESVPSQYASLSNDRGRQRFVLSKGSCGFDLV